MCISFCYLGIVAYFFSLADGATIPGMAKGGFEAGATEGATDGVAVDFAARAVLVGEAGTAGTLVADGKLAMVDEVLEGAGTALLVVGAAGLEDPVGEALVLVGMPVEADGSTLLFVRPVLELGIGGLLEVRMSEAMLEEAMVLEDGGVVPDWVIAELVAAELLDDTEVELLDKEVSVAVADVDEAEADERL